MSRNAIHTPLASDGRPAGYGSDGTQSRQQWLTQKRADDEAEERARLAKGAAQFKAEKAAAKSATEPPTPPSNDKE